MDVKILPWEKGTDSFALNDEQILLIHKVNKSDSDDTVMLPFRRVDYSIYNVKTKVREKILPELSKYMAAKFTYAYSDCRFLYFIHLEYPCFPLATFSLFSYDIENHVCKEIYRFEDNLQSYEKGKEVQLFLLNDQYILFQIMQEKGNVPKQPYISFLYDIKNKVSYDIFDKRFLVQGIQQMLSVANNVCAIRFGHNQLKNGSLFPIKKGDCTYETICLMSISQFIADVLLKIKIISAEIIDEVYIEKTLSEIKKLGKYIVYSRIDREKGNQEIFFYQYITKEVSMLLNNNQYSPDNIFPCVMNGYPIVVRKTKKYYEFYRIGDDKIILKLSPKDKILFCDMDYMILKKNSLFWGNDEIIEIYQFSSMKKIYKGIFKNIRFLPIGKETLIVFAEDRND